MSEPEASKHFQVATPRAVAKLVTLMAQNRLVSPRASAEMKFLLRKQKPYTTVAEFRARLPQGVHLASEDMLDVMSRFFEVTVEARQGASVARARALVRREPDHWPIVVWQVVE